MNFKELLQLAKSGEEFAIKQLLNMYRPLLMKEAVVDGAFDEDLFQELQITFLCCVEKIKI